MVYARRSRETFIRISMCRARSGDNFLEYIRKSLDTLLVARAVLLFLMTSSIAIEEFTRARAYRGSFAGNNSVSASRR